MEKQTLLLVDDDPLVVSGLRRSLRCAGWNVVTATSVSEALKLAQSTRPDVCLVDVLMPEGGAIGFFTGLREMGIEIPIVMMSGARAILQVAKDSLRSSVHLIEKPFSPQAATTILHLAIDSSACRPLTQRTLPEKIDDVLASAMKGTAHIPSLDPTLAAALPLFSNESSKMSTLTAILAQDAAASIAVLRAANSAAYAAQHRITSIEEAFVRIGKNEIAELVLQVTIRRVLSLKRSPFAAWGRQLWKRSVATACAARSLAAFLPDFGVSPATAYTAGLFHDIGESIALCALSQSRLPLTADDIAEPISAYHEAMGALALSYWNIPQPLPQLAGRHHAPAVDVAFEPLRRLIWAADVVADATGFYSLSAPKDDSSLDDVATTLGLTSGQLLQMTTEISERTKVS